MWKKEVESNLITNVVNFGKLLKELKEKELNGFIKVEGWDFKDYLIISNGNLIKILRIEENTKKTLDIKGYSLPSEAKLSVYESSPLLTANICKSFDFENMQTLLISGYGSEVFYSRLGIIDFNNFSKFISKTNFTGYIVVYNPVYIYANMFFSEGKLIGINTGKNWDQNAYSELKGRIHDGFISAFHIDNEDVNILCSLKFGYKINGENTGFAVSETERVIQFVFEGMEVKTLKINDESIDELTLGEIQDKKFYSVNYTENFNTLDFNFEEIFEESETYIEREKVRKLKEFFIDVMGPVGSILWDKVFESAGISQEKITPSELKYIVSKLSSEIPEEDVRNEFIRKVKEVLNEITS